MNSKQIRRSITKTPDVQKTPEHSDDNCLELLCSVSFGKMIANRLNFTEVDYLSMEIE